MIPPLEIHRPETLAEASALLERHGDDAVPYAGGTELVLVMKLGLADHHHLVDVKGLSALSGIRLTDHSLWIGATTTHRAIERSAEVRQALPAFASATAEIANLRVRGTGTLGGNLCFADPHSDSATFLLAAGASLVVQRGEDAPRSIPAGEFQRGMYETALRPGELLLGVDIPRPGPDVGMAHQRVVLSERPAVVATARVGLAGQRLDGVRIAVGAVCGAPRRATRAEQVLEGTPLAEVDAVLAAGAGEVAADEVAITDHGDGTLAHRRQLVRTLVGRAVLAAVRDLLSA